jgi:hypothetical protein
MKYEPTDYIIEEAKGYLYLLQQHDPSISEMQLTFHSNSLGKIIVKLPPEDYQPPS